MPFRLLFARIMCLSYCTHEYVSCILNLQFVLVIEKVTISTPNPVVSSPTLHLAVLIKEEEETSRPQQPPICKTTNYLPTKTEMLQKQVISIWKNYIITGVFSSSRRFLV